MIVFCVVCHKLIAGKICDLHSGDPTVKLAICPECDRTLCAKCRRKIGKKLAEDARAGGAR